MQEALPDLNGKVVADVGAGTGLLLHDLNRLVGPEGQVLAVEISDGFLKMLRKKVESHGLDR